MVPFVGPVVGDRDAMVGARLDAVVGAVMPSNREGREMRVSGIDVEVDNSSFP